MGVAPRSLAPSPHSRHVAALLVVVIVVAVSTAQSPAAPRSQDTTTLLEATPLHRLGDVLFVGQLLLALGAAVTLDVELPKIS